MQGAWVRSLVRELDSTCHNLDVTCYNQDPAEPKKKKKGSPYYGRPSPCQSPGLADQSTGRVSVSFCLAGPPRAEHTTHNLTQWVSPSR